MRPNNIIIKLFCWKPQKRCFKSSYRRKIIVQLLASRNSKDPSLNFLSITLQLQLSLILQCDCMLSQWNAHYRNSVSQISFCASKIIIARRHQKKSLNIWLLLKHYYYDWKRTENFFVQSTKVNFDHILSGYKISVYACMHTWAKHEGS